MEVKQQKRIYYLDFARGIAIFFMITQHCILVHEKTKGEGATILGNIFLLLGTAPAAPVFMVIMGIFMEKSGIHIKQGSIRGLKLLLFAYLLNILRFVLPMSLGTALGLTGLKELYDVFFMVDILQLAGLSYIFISLLQIIPFHRIIYPLIIIIILIVSPFIWGIDNLTVTKVLWGTDKETVFFPFFPWVVYPMIGVFLSEFFLTIVIKKNFIKSILFGVIFFISGIALFNIFPAGDYSRSGASIHLLIFGFIFLWFPLCVFITGKMKEDNIVLKLLTFWSKNVTVIYCVQWILFGWSILIFDMNKQTDVIALLIGFCIMVITHFLTKSARVRYLLSWV